MTNNSFNQEINLIENFLNNDSESFEIEKISQNSSNNESSSSSSISSLLTLSPINYNETRDWDYINNKINSFNKLNSPYYKNYEEYKTANQFFLRINSNLKDEDYIKELSLLLGLEYKK